VTRDDSDRRQRATSTLHPSRARTRDDVGARSVAAKPVASTNPSGTRVALDLDGSTMGTHAFQEHVGEVQLRIEAASLEELFAEAARALAELIGTPSDEPSGPWREVTVDARDREALLVAWLDELIARTEIDGLRYAEVVVEGLTAHELRARIRGVPIAESRTAVKAATLHDIRIDSGPGGVSATVVLDV